MVDCVWRGMYCNAILFALLLLVYCYPICHGFQSIPLVVTGGRRSRYVVVGNEHQNHDRRLRRQRKRQALPLPLASSSFHDEPKPSYDNNDARDADSSTILQPRTTATTTTTTSSTATSHPAITTTTADITTTTTALSMSVEELGERLGGTGRSRIAWDCYRNGIDPQIFFSKNGNHQQYYSQPQQQENNIGNNDETNKEEQLLLKTTDTESNQMLQNLLPNSRQTQTLGKETLELLSNVNGGRTVEGGLASLIQVYKSNDNTTKLLLQLQDGMQIETVLIPWWMEEEEKAMTSIGRSRTTVCISSQVGCRQACTFCATGQMGKLRSLTADEILVQLFYAIKIARQENLPRVSNVVFMGMGEPGDNCDAVLKAVDIMSRRELFQLSKTRIMISTVAPTPQTFMDLAISSTMLAWSVHAARDELRRKLVPTTKYTMVELRQGLMDAMVLSKNQQHRRTCMLEVVLIDHVNDSIQEAMEMADFVREILTQIPNAKIVVNLIPYNTIPPKKQVVQRAVDASQSRSTDPTSVPATTRRNDDGVDDNDDSFGYFRKPTMERVVAFQKELSRRGIYSRIRETRGDDESAACGQLTTLSNTKMRK